MAENIYEGNNKNNKAAGAFSAMYGYGGKDTLASNLMTTDEVEFVQFYGGKGPDTLNYYGLGRAKSFGQNGADTFYGGANDDVFFGGKGADLLIANDGADRLKGGKGSDVLFGGLGNDWMKGGKGPDHFSFNTIPDTDLNKDVIVDFNTNKDYLHFNHFIFPMGYVKLGHFEQTIVRLGKGPKDDNDFFGYDAKTGIVWYDSNADAKGGFEEVADVGKNLPITYYHFWFD